MKKNCLICSKEFKCRDCRIDAKYCSLKCKYIGISQRRIGFKHSQETKQKIGQSNLGILLGYKCSKEQNQERSKRLKHEYATGKRVAYWKDKKFSEKHIENMRKAQKGLSIGRKRSDESKKKSSLSHIGLSVQNNHWNWQGGRVDLQKRIRNSNKYLKWRSDVFKRDNWICQTCNSRSQKGNGLRLEAHHIKSVKFILDNNEILTFEEAMRCRDLWNTNNGITLCRKCHLLTKSNKERKYATKRIS